MDQKTESRNLLPAEEDREDSQSGCHGEKPPCWKDHCQPGNGEGGEGVAHHHHEERNSSAAHSTVLHNYSEMI